MSHSTRTITNKHQKHTKVHSQQYLFDTSELDDDIQQDNDKAELQEQADRYYMIVRKEIRLNAQRLRMRYS